MLDKTHDTVPRIDRADTEENPHIKEESENKKIEELKKIRDSDKKISAQEFKDNWIYLSPESSKRWSLPDNNLLEEMKSEIKSNGDKIFNSKSDKIEILKLIEQIKETFL